MNANRPIYERIELLEPLKGPLRTAAIVLLVLLIMVCALLVNVTGGTKYVYTHTMYLPILLAALAFRREGGLAAAILGGLLVGPLMPLDVATGEAQALINWLYRMFMFALIGGIAGLVVQTGTAHIKRLRWMAYHDPSTLLRNRRSLTLYLEALAGSTAEQFSFLLINTDNLEDIINTLGYPYGDAIFSEVAARLDALLDDETAVFRVQNGQMGIVLKGASPQAEAALANDVAREMRESFMVEGLPVFVDVSMGIVRFPEHGVVAESLIRKANIARLNARRKGRMHAVYNIGSDVTSRAGLALLGAIPEALAANQFTLYYQPKYDLQQSHISGVEALLRWQHPQIGLVPPATFVPQIERTGLIRPMTRWVIARAFYEMSQWQRSGYRLSVAINISTKNLQEPDFLDFLFGAIAQTAIDPARVELELTESSLMVEPEQTIERLRTIRDHGIQIAVDDFGIGYSSLGYLRTLPISLVKIDRTFVSNLFSDDGSRGIVEATIGIGKNLGLQVVAEGVEDQGTLKMLALMGCDYAQGYVIGHPLPAADMLQLVGSNVVLDNEATFNE